jgi:hypothetical protein
VRRVEFHPGFRHVRSETALCRTSFRFIGRARHADLHVWFSEWLSAGGNARVGRGRPRDPPQIIQLLRSVRESGENLSFEFVAVHRQIGRAEFEDRSLELGDRFHPSSRVASTDDPGDRRATEVRVQAELMDGFELRASGVEEYGHSVRSVVTIRDPRIDALVRDEFDRGLPWPEPLVQLNPGFERGESLDSLIRRGVLHPRCADVFRDKPTAGTERGPLERVGAGIGLAGDEVRPEPVEQIGGVHAVFEAELAIERAYEAVDGAGHVAGEVDDPVTGGGWSSFGDVESYRWATRAILEKGAWENSEGRRRRRSSLREGSATTGSCEAG